MVKILMLAALTMCASVMLERAAPSTAEAQGANCAAKCMNKYPDRVGARNKCMDNCTRR